MELAEIAAFLETESLSATFSPAGLQYLSLRNNWGELQINLSPDSKEAENPAVKQLLEETARFIETGRHRQPLDLGACTAFQQLVFEAVGRIAPGTVLTYGELAGILGKPGAAQAVGSAVARNPVSYFIPTHRVIPRRGIAICRTGAGFLREKLLAHEGHDLAALRGNYLCNRKKCSLE